MQNQNINEITPEGRRTLSDLLEAVKEAIRIFGDREYKLESEDVDVLSIDNDGKVIIGGRNK